MCVCVTWILIFSLLLGFLSDLKSFRCVCLILTPREREMTRHRCFCHRPCSESPAECVIVSMGVLKHLKTPEIGTATVVGKVMSALKHINNTGVLMFCPHVVNFCTETQ